MERQGTGNAVLNKFSMDEKMCLYFLFHNRVAFRDYFLPIVLRPDYKTRYYQYAPALCDELVWGGSRTIGKSLDLDMTIIQKAIITPGNKESLVSSYRKTHIKDRMEDVISYMSAHRFLKSFFKTDSENSLKSAITRSPIYTIRLKNGHVISGISVGDDVNCVAIQGHHPCLHPDQKVLLANGKSLAIRRIIAKIRKKEIVFVKSYNFKKNLFEDKQVIDSWYSSGKDKKMLRIILEDNSNSLMTENHKVYSKTNNQIKLISADKLKKGNLVLSSEPDFTSGQKSLIFGSLLGDASLRKEDWYRNGSRGVSKKKKNIKNASYRVTFSHSATHAEYVKFKFDVMRNLTAVRGFKMEKQAPTAYGHTIARFSTKCLVVFDRIAKLLKYKKGRKKITKEFLEHVDVKALAIWFMDDGSISLSHGGVIKYLYLHTEGFSFSENKLLKKWFFCKFQLKCKIQESKGYYYLIFNRENALKFLKSIIFYLHPLFIYKIANIEIDISLIGKKLNEFFLEEKQPFLWKKVDNVKIEKNVSRVCDLSIKDNKNYIAGSFLVSNCIRYIEETQSYPRHAWLKFQNTQAQEGSIDRYYGVPDGRMDTPFREMDTKIRKFIGKRFHISRRLDPNFNQDRKAQYIQSLGGEDSNEFKAQIDAEWGEPTWGVWNEQDILGNFQRNASGDYVKRLQRVDILLKDYTTPGESLYMLRPLPESGLDVILAIDSGYSEPTVILPFFYWRNHWNMETMIRLKDRIIPDDQADIIDYIADFYKAIFISIDCTSADGRAPATSLTNPKRASFAGKRYDKRVVMVEFNKSELIGYQRPDDVNKPLIEITEKVKNHTTNILRTKFANTEFNMAYDEDILAEFNFESQKREADRTKIITPQNVHIPEAFRVFAYAWWKAYAKVERPDFEGEYEDYDFVLPEYQDTNFALFGRGQKSVLFH